MICNNIGATFRRDKVRALLLRVFWSGLVGCFLGWACGTLWAQEGAAVYRINCAPCHENGQGPSPALLRTMSPEHILVAIERGSMSRQGSERSPEERRALAEFLSGKPFGSEPPNTISKSAYCGGSGSRFREDGSGPAWNGWGGTPSNTRFQPGAAAGISPDDVPRLQLKWAFGFPGDTSASAQPVVLGGRVYVGSWGGTVYSLDAKTGCIYWMIEAQSGVRSAISIGKSGDGRLTAYFGDLAANAYAVDAATGNLLWKVKVDDFPLARITGSPTLYGGRLYVPVASYEESQAVDPRYQCCKFRGSLVALDAATGKQLWKTYTIRQGASPAKKNGIGTQLWGPSGAAIWVSPTLDLKRKLIYVGTGNSYSSPAAGTSDAVIAMDMMSGKIRWVRQFTQNDVWTAGCQPRAHDHSNCEVPNSPDFDFGSSPILVERKGGRRMLIAPPKSGVFALDPDREGKIVWQQRVGSGGKITDILWGPAADGENLYVGISDAKRVGSTEQHDPNAGGGMVALDLSSGQKLWDTPPPGCGSRRPCSPAQSAAVTAIPGVVFSGAADGHLRAYSARDGKILWDYDTAREYTTVNGVQARGGSIDNGGPAVAGGMLFTNAGYSHHHAGAIPGNVLLAFSVE